MKPIQTIRTNHVYHGPTLEIDDLPCRRVRPGLIVSWWRLSDVERRAIAAGADLRLQIGHEPIPPVAIDVVAREIEVRQPFRHEPGTCTICDRLRDG